ncbi:MAG: NAD(P)H-binding protein [Nitrospirae bacterium]|nr:NAD(P)H-binding protein [Nitrospirota bacterium]MCL5422370.1 NAD(P)H-binding protein [Nitrospirota bacterium]
MVNSREVHIVTGAFGFSGKYIARRLLDARHEVRTITNSLNRENPFKGRVNAYPYNFDHPEKLIESLRGASVLYNTYWVRFNYPGFTYSSAVDNTLKLFDAAKGAGIKRIVHVSITNPSENSPFEYFRDKAKLEGALKESGLSYAILRPALLFGKEGILINNIAWLLRKFPVFGVFGDGNYRVQPIYVDDLAKLAVEQGQKTENCIIDAIGPETFTYRKLVEVIGNSIGKRRPIISIPPAIGYFVGSLVGKLLGDVTITRDEIEGLMGGLLYTNSPPVGETELTDWIKENASTLGMHYSSELARRRNRTVSYEKL